MQKQPDSGVRPLTSLSPSIILEVGDLGSLGQLQTDARLWRYARGWPINVFVSTHSPELLQVQLVILLLIDPLAPNSTLPRISLQLWKSALYSNSAAKGSPDGLGYRLDE